MEGNTTTKSTRNNLSGMIQSMDQKGWCEQGENRSVHEGGMKRKRVTDRKGKRRAHLSLWLQG